MKRREEILGSGIMVVVVIPVCVTDAVLSMGAKLGQSMCLKDIKGLGYYLREYGTLR